MEALCLYRLLPITMLRTIPQRFSCAIILARDSQAPWRLLTIRRTDSGPWHFALIILGVLSGVCTDWSSCLARMDSFSQQIYNATGLFYHPQQLLAAKLSLPLCFQEGAERWDGDLACCPYDG